MDFLPMVRLFFNPVYREFARLLGPCGGRRQSTTDSIQSDADSTRPLATHGRRISAVGKAFKPTLDAFDIVNGIISCQTGNVLILGKGASDWADKMSKNRLRPSVTWFPEPGYPTGSLPSIRYDAIVIRYLSPNGAEVKQNDNKEKNHVDLTKWMKPGGDVFIVNSRESKVDRKFLKIDSLGCLQEKDCDDRLEDVSKRSTVTHWKLRGKPMQ